MKEQFVPFNLSGKIALVTGATGGIGGAIASRLHKAGAHLIITGRNRERLELLKKQLTDRCTIEVCSLDSLDDITTLVTKINDEVGNVDILVNNAGITKDSLFLKMKMDDWEEVMNVNLRAPVFLTQKLLFGMLKNRWGRIINISSIVGVMGNIGQTNYSASKAGMIAFSKSLAREVASRGVTVNCVAPGFVETNMTNRLAKNIIDTLVKNIPLGRQGFSEEIAEVVLFLSSKESSYITGETIHINGGALMT